MRWVIFVNKKVSGKYISTRENLELPGTSPYDIFYISKLACQKFEVEKENALCMPCCTKECTYAKHSAICKERWQAGNSHRN